MDGHHIMPRPDFFPQGFQDSLKHPICSGSLIKEIAQVFSI